MADIHAHPHIRKQNVKAKREKSLDVILDKVDGLIPIAQKLNCTLAQLALAWVCPAVLCVALCLFTDSLLVNRLHVCIVRVRA